MKTSEIEVFAHGYPYKNIPMRLLVNITTYGSEESRATNRVWSELCFETWILRPAIPSKGDIIGDLKNPVGANIVVNTVAYGEDIITVYAAIYRCFNDEVEVRLKYDPEIWKSIPPSDTLYADEKLSWTSDLDHDALIGKCNSILGSLNYISRNV
jgi:hypothetical protein